MTQTQRKLKHIRVLETVRQSKVDDESVKLAEIRVNKKEKALELKNSQVEYLAGVEKLNELRTSLIRQNLQFMEDNLDFLKAKWMRLFRELQDLERQEKLQLENLATADRELKVVGNLAVKLESESRTEISRAEQKVQDERVIERSWNTNRRT